MSDRMWSHKDLKLIRLLNGSRIRGGIRLVGQHPIQKSFTCIHSSFSQFHTKHSCLVNQVSPRSWWCFIVVIRFGPIKGFAIIKSRDNAAKCVIREPVRVVLCRHSTPRGTLETGGTPM